MRQLEMEQRAVEVAGRTARFEVTGSGPPVLLVHGLSGSPRWWKSLVPTLTHAHRAYLVSLPAYAGRNSDVPLEHRDSTAWVAAWMESVGLERVDVVGHSLGGLIGLRLAARRPELVRRVVAIAPAGLWKRTSTFAYVVPLARTVLQAAPRLLPLLARDAVRAGPWSLWRAARELLAEDVRDELARVSAPTLLVWGAKDHLVPPTFGEVFRNEIENARLLVLPGAGHVPMIDSPDSLAEAVTAFLAGESIGD